MMNINPILNNNTSIGLFDSEGSVKVEKLASFMDISKEELASAFGFTKSQLRKDKIADRTKNIMADLAGSIEWVANCLSGNKQKTRQWFNLPNVHFGGSSPKTIILAGRFYRVKNFIYSSQSR